MSYNASKKARLKDLKRAASKNKALTDALTARVSTLETAKTNHNSRITTLESAKTSHNSRITALETADTEIIQRLEWLEDLAEALLGVTNSVINNINKN